MMNYWKPYICFKNSWLSLIMHNKVEPKFDKCTRSFDLGLSKLMWRCHFALDMFIVCITTDVGKYLLTFTLPPLQKATKKGFWSPILWQLKILVTTLQQQKIFNCCNVSEQLLTTKKIQLPLIMVTKFFRSP